MYYLNSYFLTEQSKMHKNNIKQSLIGYPKKQGLYNPNHEKDACGFGFIANLDNIPKHDIIHQALDISLPKNFDSNLCFLEFIQFLFPCTVFISPLWHKYLNGWANFHDGKVLVENL